MLLKSDILSHNTGHHEDTYSTLQSFRQQVFVKHEFHYLDVPTVGTFIVYDVFDCTLECLSNPLCFSLNLAASKGVNGEHWCDLLSSDKYRDVTEYRRNWTAHHFAIKVEEILLSSLLISRKGSNIKARQLFS